MLINLKGTVECKQEEPIQLYVRLQQVNEVPASHFLKHLGISTKTTQILVQDLQVIPQKPQTFGLQMRSISISMQTEESDLENKKFKHPQRFFTLSSKVYGVVCFVPINVKVRTRPSGRLKHNS